MDNDPRVTADLPPPDADRPEASADPDRIGCVDLMSADEIVGWAWDPDQPEASVVVELVDGDTVIAAMPADTYRADLEAAGIGSGRHGFRFQEVGRALPNVCHLLRLRRAHDGVELSGSPRWVTNVGGELDERGAKMVEDLANAAIQTIGDPAKLEAFLAMYVDCTLRIGERLRTLRKPGSSASAGSVVGRLRQQFPEFALPLRDQPRVSVIVPVYNKFQLTYQCLNSIANNLPEVAFEILVIDDGSTDETVLAGMLLPRSVRVVRLHENSGFIAACNRGAELASGEFLLFLNNDTLMLPDWLDPLVATFDRDERIGIAGARLLSEDGKVQDAGGLVWRLGDAWNMGRGCDPADPRFTYMRDVDYVTGAALLIRRELFASLGGFDPHFAPAYYEDTDLAFRVRKAGMRVVIQPAAQIVHLEGGSSGTDPAQGVKRYQLLNQAKFSRRWRHVLAAYRPNGELPEQEAERSVTKRAYFIDDVVPMPDMDAGSNAALQHMLVLIALGYKVTFFAADNMARNDPYTRDLESYGIECVYHPFSGSVEQVFRTAQSPPDLIYLHRFSNAFKYTGIARLHFPDCPILYSVADLQFVRLGREATIKRRRELEAEAETARAQDLAMMRLVDGVIVHSNYEAALLRSLEPDIPVHVLCWSVPTRTLETPLARRTGIAFVGGYQHRPNVDAAVYLAREIMPLVRDQGLKIPCHLAGSQMPPEVTSLRAPGIYIAGFVPDLASLFNKIRCTVAPLRYGAGVKGKVLDSFAYGLPCVMSEIAAEGLDLPDELLWLVARSPDDFALKIAALHRDDELALRLARAGLAFIERDFSFAVIRDQLRQVVVAASAKKQAAAAQDPTVS